MTRYRRFTLPSGMVLSCPDEGFRPTYGTYVSPTSFIPFDTQEDREREEARQREAAAEKVRAILSEASWAGKA